MKRREILSNLVSALKEINTSTDTSPLAYRQPYTYQSNVFDNVFNKYKFMDEINDFPCVCVYNVVDSITHSGSNIKYGTLSINIRGYVRSSEDVITDCEKLVDDIEYVVNSFRYRESSRNLCVVDSRVLTLETDEGLFDPFGVINLEVQINYER